MTSEYPDNIIFFDGVCNLCNKAVDRVIRYDRERYFKIASLQSGFASKFFNQIGFDVEKIDSIIVYSEGRILTESEAIFYIARHIKGWPRLIHYFRWLPKSLADWVYQFVARNRFSLFGERDTCRVPNEEERKVFLE